MNIQHRISDSIMDSSQIRSRFISFFEKAGHKYVSSSSLVPGNDPTLLFTNSGMAQFKDVFLGFDKRDYKRAVTSQRCLRAGGKHNDLENVGYTARHHTLFEMLGNFSFGDYFKQEAVEYAWKLLTDPKEGYGIKREYLWITVFGGGKLFGEDSPEVPADIVAREHWETVLQQAGFSASEAKARVIDVPTIDNFWMMGDTGPCGPCSEIFYNIDGNATEFEGEIEAKADSCIEIWNLVFMQFNRDEAGVLHDLPAPCVDTGMGLERLSAVLQGVKSNFETDLLANLLDHAKWAIEAAGGKATKQTSLQVIADHIRAAAYLIADGVLPSNEGRGYVLRRIIRRALRHGHQLGTEQPFFAQLAEPLAELMGDAHPILRERLDAVTISLVREEESFATTLNTGMVKLAKAITGNSKQTIAGELAFELYDTYGFPLDLTQDYAREHKLQVDVAEFNRCMEKQRERSRQSTTFKVSQQAINYQAEATKFLRDETEVEAKIVAIFVNDNEVAKLEQDQTGLIVLDKTVFYARAGGQVGDIGAISIEGCKAKVEDTIRLRADVHAHQVKLVEGELAVGQRVHVRIDRLHREATSRAHSATHLLHAALRRTLGQHAVQRGSQVTLDRLRFDFTHDAPVTSDQLAQIEQIINEQVIANAPVQINEMAYDAAIDLGAMALFGEKYGNKVRVVTIDPAYSVELCGGTHVVSAGNIGFVRLQTEEAVAAGIRRVSALTADAAVSDSREQGLRIDQIASSLKVQATKIERRLEDILADNKQLKRQLQTVNSVRNATETDRLAKAAIDLADGSKAVIAELKGVNGGDLREVAKLLTRKLNQTSKNGSAIMLMSVQDGRFSQLVSIAKLSISANDWLASSLKLSGAKGGGSPQLAQATGGKPTKQVSELVQSADDWLQKTVN